MTVSCFVIMPIGDQTFVTGSVSSVVLKAKYNDLIREALLKARPDLEVIRADEVAAPGGITSDILNRIMKSDYILADITYPNPNVFYELGLRHACRPGTILIRDVNGPRAPFDVSDLRHIPYENTATGLRLLAENLAKQMDWIDEHPSHPDNLFLELAKITSFQFPTYNRRIFPPIIESAIAEQLYSLNFYKERIVFIVNVIEVGDKEVEFITELSYLVTNRSNERHNWLMQYKFRDGKSEPLEVRFNNSILDPGILDHKYGRGVNIHQPMRPSEKAEIYFKVKERFRLQDSELYTSYNPATDLKVRVCNPFAKLIFDFEIFYFANVVPVRTGDQTEVYFDSGLLPHQGIRLNWKGA